MIDCANGAAYRVVPEALWELGADVVRWVSNPDGFNINKECGSTSPEALCRKVREMRADIGIALDGDADRVILVAIDHMAALVDQDHAIGIAVEGDAYIGAHLPYLAAERFRRGRSAFLVDVETVGFDTHRNHIGAELPQRFRDHFVGRAVGAVDHDAQAVKRESRGSVRLANSI